MNSCVQQDDQKDQVTEVAAFEQLYVFHMVYSEKLKFMTFFYGRFNICIWFFFWSLDGQHPKNSYFWGADHQDFRKKSAFDSL